MSVSATEFETRRSIPKVTCPRCGTHMRLAVVLPLEKQSRETMVFDCCCGFEYRQSSTVAAYWRTRDMGELSRISDL